jgi:hypothetical protein
MKSKNRFQIILLSHWSTCAATSAATTRRGSWSARRTSWRSASNLSSSPTPPRFSGKRSYSWVCTTVKSWRRSLKLTWSCTPGGAVHVESSLPICLKPPGFFNPRAYLVKTRFQSLLSKCSLYRYNPQRVRPRAGVHPSAAAAREDDGGGAHRRHGGRGEYTQSPGCVFQRYSCYRRAKNFANMDKRYGTVVKGVPFKAS